MTNQEIYTKVRDHLLTQMKKSQGLLQREDHGEYMTCLYYGPDGLKCAVGALIPENMYNPRMEGEGVDTDIIKNALDYSEEQKRLLQELQCVHDEHDPDEWQGKLWDVADDFGLER